MSLGVLIVEDESEFRAYLMQAVPWYRYDMRVVGATDDVSSARELLGKERVDLVLLDITLQRSDGLELVEDLKALQPSPRIIVITGHSEFETVRRALRLGVDDYLLKPFAGQELLMSVISNREHLLERLREFRQELTLQETMIDGWLYQLLRAESSTELRHLLELLSRRDVSIPAAPRVLICTGLSIDTTERSVHRRWVKHLGETWKVTAAQADARGCTGLDDRIYVLLSGTEPSEVAWDAHDMAEEFLGQARKRFPLTLRIGISGVETAGMDLQPLYRQALTALSRATEDAPVVTWSREPESFEAMGRTGTWKTGNDSEERGSLVSHWHRIAREFIEDYHHDPTLDVQTVASHLGISTEYLRQVFRQTEGLSCIEVITGRRMDHAKVLLRSESVPISEVAARSGFQDPAYFSRQFRRFVGMSPREYRAL